MKDGITLKEPILYGILHELANNKLDCPLVISAATQLIKFRNQFVKLQTRPDSDLEMIIAMFRSLHASPAKLSAWLTGASKALKLSYTTERLEHRHRAGRLSIAHPCMPGSSPARYRGSRTCMSILCYVQAWTPRSVGSRRHNAASTSQAMDLHPVCGELCRI